MDRFHIFSNNATCAQKLNISLLIAKPKRRAGRSSQCLVLGDRHVIIIRRTLHLIILHNAKKETFSNRFKRAKYSQLTSDPVNTDGLMKLAYQRNFKKNNQII